MLVIPDEAEREDGGFEVSLGNIVTPQSKI
jgi:hypothetical protein